MTTPDRAAHPTDVTDTSSGVGASTGVDTDSAEVTHASQEPLTTDVIVLGGGPAGVATALEVARRGLSVVLLERERTTGGMAGSFEIDGMRVDHGSHRLHPVTPPAVLSRLTELLGEDLQRRPRHGRLSLLGRWVDFPLRPAGIATAMPRTWLAAVLRDVALSPLRTLRPARRPPSYAASLRSSLGPAVYDALYAPYAKKLWGLPGEEIDAEQARVRVSADTVPKVALRVLRGQARRARSLAHRVSRSRGANPDAGPGATFLYPRRGFGQIVEALDQAARAAGADIRTGVPVTAIEAAELSEPSSLVTVRTADGAVWRAARIFSTLPIPLLARLSSPAPPSHVIEDARALRFRAMVLVYLTHHPGAHPSGLSSPAGTADPDPSGVSSPSGAEGLSSIASPSEADPVRWSAYDAHYLPGAGTPITRISEPANYRDSSEDPRDRSVLCAEIPCDVGDELWDAGDDALAAVVRDAVAAFDLPPLHCTAVHTRRLRAVYPVYEHGFSERLARLEAWAEDVPGVTTLGRSGLFAHDNTHHAFVMAGAAAQCLHDDGTFDDLAWRRARESFREHVVED